MNTISVIIPSQNRPALLAEAIGSALQQTRMPGEIVVVDDGSQPPVDAAALARQFGAVVRVLRNDSAQGLAWARNQGVEGAQGDYIVHLDDDDLYAPDMLATCAQALDADPALQLVFVGVQGFGHASEYFNRVHPQGVAKVITQGAGVLIAEDLYHFSSLLLQGLLNQVPMPFQRIMARRAVWHKVSALRLASYQSALQLVSPDEARALIRGTLRDSEWALYAALACSKLALINKPLYLQRCDGQGSSSRPAMRLKHIEQSVTIKSVMNKAAISQAAMRPYRRHIREILAQTHFDAAYELTHSGMHAQAMTHLRKSFLLGPQARHLRLLGKLGLACITQGRGPAPA